MQRYINECVFRINQTTEEKVTMETLDGLLKHSIDKWLTYRDLITSSKSSHVSYQQRLAYRNQLWAKHGYSSV